MDHSINSSQYCNTLGDILKAHALMKALPKNFVLKSTAAQTIMIDPALTAAKLVPLIDKVWKVLVVSGTTAYYSGKNSIMSATFMPGRVDIHVYSSDLQAEMRAVKLIEPFEKYKFENKEEGGVWVNFSFMNGMNVERNNQFIRCPDWSEIRGNYARSCQEELDRSMEMKKPWDEGRLMIWHGEPGTGKTFAIRSLLMAWRDRFNFVIVTDPEKLLASPSYYYEVASAPNMNAVPGAQSNDDDDQDPNYSKKKRLLFIIEDSGDLISTESRRKHWDKFGKLLNITDGLIGQGREDIFLLTFNEELREIDPAIVRPGRCISKLEFQKFPLEDAQSWLTRNGVGHLEPFGADRLSPVASLAELYQIKSKGKNQVPVQV